MIKDLKKGFFSTRKTSLVDTCGWIMGATHNKTLIESGLGILMDLNQGVSSSSEIKTFCISLRDHKFGSVSRILWTVTNKRFNWHGVIYWNSITHSKCQPGGLWPRNLHGEGNNKIDVGPVGVVFDLILCRRSFQIGIYLHMCKLHAKINEAEKLFPFKYFLNGQFRSFPSFGK